MSVSRGGPTWPIRPEVLKISTENYKSCVLESEMLSAHLSTFPCHVYYIPSSTPWAVKKLANLFFTITLVFLDGFLHCSPIEREMNTLSYLMDWWRHNCVTLQCSLHWVISYAKKINALVYGKMLSSEDRILIKTCGNLKDFLPEDLPRNTLTKVEKRDIGRLSAKVALAFDRTHCRKPSVTVIPNCR